MAGIPAPPLVNEALLAGHLERIGAALPGSEPLAEVLAPFIRTADEGELVRMIAGTSAMV